MDMTPQKPVQQSENVHYSETRDMGYSPFISVIKSAMCRARASEKCPASEDRRRACLSCALHLLLRPGIAGICQSLTEVFCRRSSVLRALRRAVSSRHGCRKGSLKTGVGFPVK
jgi:hypothetical protein